MIIKLSEPADGALVTLLRHEHVKFMNDPDTYIVSKVDWLNLKDTGADLSYPDVTKLCYEPPLDGIITLRSDKETRRIEASGGCADVTNLYIDTEYEWSVSIGQEKSEIHRFHTHAATPRLLYVDGISNVRDIGGYRTIDDGTVRQGMVYRTSEMDSHVQITEIGKQTLLDEVGIRTDMDIRGINNEPVTAVLDESRVRWLNFPLAAYASIFTKEQMALYKETFELLADRDVYPLMLHCWGGIDRTGTWLYILGGMLGVGEDDLGRDYEMSSFSRWGRRSRRSEQFCEFLAELYKYGDSLQDACVGFLAACGVSGETVIRIRDILIEKGK